MHQADNPEFESFIGFACPTCGFGNQDVIGVPRTNHHPAKTADRVTEQDHEYICGRCLQRLRLKVRNLSGRVAVAVVDFPSVKVDASDAYWAEEAEALGINPWEMPAEPYEIFANTVKDVLDVIESPDAEFFGKTLARMAFIQLFAAIEAFLTDTLLTRIFDDRDRLGRVLVGVKDVQGIKVSLADVLANPDIVRQMVAEAVHKVSFHNFAKTDSIWNIAFGHSIFKDEEVKERLLRYVAIRHDCVHRNGKSEDGTERREVDYEFVREVAHSFEGTALFIEGKFEGEAFETGLLDEDEARF